MKKRFAVLIVALLASLLLPATVSAADASGNGDFVFKVGGTNTVGPGERTGSVIIVNGDAVVAGTVTSTLWVINGDATVSGRVDADVMVVDGTLTLTSTAAVNNVALVRSTLTRDPAATISGTLNERSAFVNFGWGRAVFSFAFWTGATFLLLLIGLLFAGVAGAQLSHADGLLATQTGQSIVAALLVWIGLPILGVAAILTLIGIPLGIAAFLALPVIWVLGYVVAGAFVGNLIVQRLKAGGHPEHPFLATTVGILAFQFVGLIPFVGGAVVSLAGVVGSGALAYLAYLAFRRRHAAGSRAKQVLHAPVATA